jgi:predicted flap endonuclease-1-like 5' DNA nuclease
MSLEPAAIVAAVGTAGAALILAGSSVLLGRIVRDRRVRDASRRSLIDEARHKARTAGVEPDARHHADTDDLKVIEGIGPRLERVLRAAGVTTYAQLAELRPGRIRTLLKESGTRMADPRSWPEQAALAAEGRWDELARVQKDLHRGKRKASAA